MNKINFKRIRNMGLIILVSAIIGTLLLMLTVSLPSTRAKQNMRESTYIMNLEGDYYKQIGDYESTQLDNFTDALIIGEALYDGKENVINKSMNAYRYITKGKENRVATEDLTDFLWNEPEVQQEIQEPFEYPRYWHGIIVPIKILLTIFNYAELRLINSFVQILVVGLLIYLMTKKKLHNYILPLLIAYFFITPMTVSSSIQFSTVFYISMLSSISLLLLNDKLKKNNLYPYLFLITGILVSYFDLLTYPILSVSLPITFYYLLNKKEKLLDNIKDMFFICLAWVCGYLLMWASKWIIGSILCQKDFIDIVFNQAKYRMSNDMGRIYAIKCNLSVYKHLPYIFVIVLMTLYYVIKMIKNKIKVDKKIIIDIVPYILIGLMAIVWYFALSQHSIMHNWFTHRAIVGSIFAYFVILEIISNNKKTKNN